MLPKWVRERIEYFIGILCSLCLVIVSSFVSDPKSAYELSQELLKLAIGADAALLGIVLAGLAIATTIARPEFVQWLYEQGLYSSLTRPFVVACVLWAVHLVVSTLTFVGTYVIAVPKAGFLSVIAIHGFLFGFALAVTIGLVVLVFELNQRQATFDRLMTHERGPKP